MRRWIPFLRRATAAVAGAFLSGCAGHRDVLDPATAEAMHIGRLWWGFFAVCLVVYVIVLAFLFGAIWRARRRVAAASSAAPAIFTSTDPAERPALVAVSTATAVTIVILFCLLVVDFATGRALRAPVTSGPLTVVITGHDWWWQIEYDDPTSSQIIETANELHLPVGRPVKLVLQSSDVIHSFWIPNLQGKKDLVPGHPTTLWLVPDRVGRFHGQCAEFCGLQHAHMGLLAVVESSGDFARWQDAQRRPAPDPKTPSERRGRHVFLTSSCVMCHTIGGTVAASHVGPPLTHLASRQMIAANSFPNQRGYLAGWIVDPQAMKPGVLMPQNQLSPDDLNAMLDYLESLK